MRVWRDHARAGAKEKLKSHLWSLAEQPPPSGRSPSPYYDQLMALAHLEALCEAPEERQAYEQYVVSNARKDRRNAVLWAAMTWLYHRQGTLGGKTDAINAAIPDFARNWREQKFQFAIPAVYLMSQVQTRESARALGEMLSGSNEGAEAQGALSDFPQHLLEPVVKASLNHGYDVVRRRAAELLAFAMGGEGPQLAAAWLKSPTPRVRIGAMNALFMRREPGTFEIAWGLVLDPSAEVRREAISVLSRIADEDRKPVLVDRAQHGETLEQIAAKAILVSLGDSRWAADLAKAEVLGASAETLAIALSKNPPAEVAPLLLTATRSSDKNVASKAIYGLARCPSREAVLYLCRTAADNKHPKRVFAKGGLERVPRESLPFLVDAASEVRLFWLMRRISQLVEPGDDAYVPQILDLLPDGQMTGFGAVAIGKILERRMEDTVLSRVRKLLSEGLDSTKLMMILSGLGETYQEALLPELIKKRDFMGLRSEKVYEKALASDLNTDASLAALAYWLRNMRRDFAMPQLLRLMRNGTEAVRAAAAESVGRFAGRQLATPEAAEEWWREAQAEAERKKASLVPVSRVIDFAQSHGHPFTFSPDGRYVLCFSSPGEQLKFVEAEAAREAAAFPWRPGRDVVCGFAAESAMWVLDRAGVRLFDGAQLQRTFEAPPFVSSAACIPERDELWVADPRRCSVTIHDLGGQRSPEEIALAPTVGRRYLKIAHRPGMPTVAVSNSFVRGGFLIDVQTRAVTSVPDLSLPWRGSCTACVTPDGDSVWSVEDYALVRIGTRAGEVIRGLPFTRLLAQSARLQDYAARRGSGFRRRTTIVGCTRGKAIVDIGRKAMCIIDAVTGKWRECEGVPRKPRARTLIRPVANELWVFSEGQAHVYPISAE